MATAATTTVTQMSVLPAPSIQLARSLSVGLDDLHSMSVFQLFQSQLESGSLEAAVDSMKRLSVVAAAMTTAEVAEKLLPYLTAIALKQPPHPDELLLLLGQELPTVATLLGTAHVTEFLPMLERLAAVEETVVRDQAVTVLQTLCENTKLAGTSAAAAASTTTGEGGGGSPTAAGGAAGAASTPVDPAPWMGLAKRLSSADWFTAKVSAAGMIAPVFSLVTAGSSSAAGAGGAGGGAGAAASPGSAADLSQELLSLYKDLCQDDTPMVRRAAAKHLGAVLEQAGYAHRDFCIGTLPALTRDEQDSVRLLAVAALAAAGPSFGEHPQWTTQYWLPIVKDGSTDMSWRVRHNLAKHFSNVAVNLGLSGDRRYGNEQSLVMACFVSLLTDAEAEVRAAAVAHLARMVAWGGPALFQTHLQPLLAALADDVVMEVRSKCALALMDAAHGGTLEDAVILQAFGPLLESFLQDEFHEVQLQVLGNLHKIAHLLPGLSGVVSSLMQMSKATNWRVRQAVAQLLPHLAEARGLDFFVSVLLEPAWLLLLLDPTASVRMAIVKSMPLLVRVAGEDWILQTLLPQHNRIYQNNGHSYLVRNTLLQANIEAAVQSTQTAAGSAGAATGPTPLWHELITQIVRAVTTDKVPNVRMVAATGLDRVIQVVAETGGPLQAAITTQVRPALEKVLAEEEDEDVRTACRKALDHIK